jgi:hypothetical protein
MKHPKVIFILIAYVCCSCQIEIKNAYLSDVTVDSKDLSCDGIKVINYSNKNDRTEFSYGESVSFLCDQMTGFALTDGIAFPNMNLYVMSKSGDTIMRRLNLFPTQEGHKEKDLNLRTKVIFAEPMLPDNEYLISVNIQDKNSDAYYNWKRTFSVIHSPLISTKKQGLTYGAQYLYSQVRNEAVVDNKIALEETVYLLIENIEGFDTDDNGNANIQASITLKEADGSILSENMDLLPNLVNGKDLQQQLYASVQVTKKNVKNPLTCTFRMKDNSSGNGLETTFNLTVLNVEFADDDH